MSRLPALAERVEQLLLRQDELLRTNAQLAEQLETLGREHAALQAKLTQARSQLDALLAALPNPDVSPENPA